MRRRSLDLLMIVIQLIVISMGAEEQLRNADEVYLAMPFQRVVGRYTQFYIRISLKWKNMAKKSDPKCAKGEVSLKTFPDDRSHSHFTITVQNRPDGKKSLLIENEITKKDDFLASDGDLDVFQVHYNTFTEEKAEKPYTYFSINGAKLRSGPAPGRMFDSINEGNWYDPDTQWTQIQPFTTFPEECVSVRFVAFGSTRQSMPQGASLSLGLSNFLPLSSSFPRKSRIFVRLYRRLPIKAKEQTFNLVMATLGPRKKERQLQPGVVELNIESPTKWLYNFDNELVINQINCVERVVEDFSGPNAYKNTIAVGFKEEGKAKQVCINNEAREPAFSVGVQAADYIDAFQEGLPWQLATKELEKDKLTWDLRGIRPSDSDNLNADIKQMCRQTRHLMECLFDDDGSKTCEVDAPDPILKEEETIRIERRPERVLFIGSSLDHSDPSLGSEFTVRYRIERDGKSSREESPLEKYPLTWTPQEVADYLGSASKKEPSPKNPEQ